MIRGGLLTPPFARFLIILITLAALPTCGVELKETFEGTEVFKGIALSGERVAGGELTMTLTVSQGYAVPVRIACLYENRSTRPPGWQKLAFEERATLIGGTVLPADVGAKPGGAGRAQAEPVGALGVLAAVDQGAASGVEEGQQAPSVPGDAAATVLAQAQAVRLDAGEGGERHAAERDDELRIDGCAPR